MRSKGCCSCLCLPVCHSVKSHLTSGVSVHLENSVTYSVGNGGEKNICGVFSETTPFQRSTIPLLKGHICARLSPKCVDVADSNSVLFTCMYLCSQVLCPKSINSECNVQESNESNEGFHVRVHWEVESNDEGLTTSSNHCPYVLSGGNACHNTAGQTV